MKTSNLAAPSDNSKQTKEYEWERCWSNRRKLRRNRTHSSDCECGSAEDDIFELEDLERRLRRLENQLREYINARRKSMFDYIDDNEDDYQYVSADVILNERDDHGGSLSEMRSVQRRIHDLRRRIDKQKRERALHPNEERLHEARVMLHRMRAGLSANEEEWQKILDDVEDDLEADEKDVSSRIPTSVTIPSHGERAQQAEGTKVSDDPVDCQEYLSSAQSPANSVVTGKHANDKKLVETFDNTLQVISIRSLDSDRAIDQLLNPKSLSMADRRRTILIFLTSDGQDAEVLTLSKQLSHAADSIIIFDNAVDCFEYLGTTTDCVISVIVIDDYANDWKILMMLNECPPVSIIYRRIHGQDQRPLIDEQALTNTCPKLRGSFNESNPLRRRIAVDFAPVLEPYRTFGANNMERSTRDLDAEEVIFLWFQIMINLLRAFPVTDKTRTDFLTECRTQCNDNKQRQAQIDEFQSTYMATEALKWYTRQYCVFQIVNKALREQNATMIHNLRLFINDLFTEILRKRQSATNVITLYRGQLVHNDEIHGIQDKQGGLIAFNSFLSTSSSKAVAEMFGGVGTEPSCEAHSFLLLEIEATTDLCCNLIDDTALKDEEEYLFLPGTIFKIVSLELQSARSYYAKLSYTTAEDLSRLNRVKKHFERKIRLDHGPISLAWGRFLYHLGEYNTAKEYYLTLLADDVHNHFQFIDTIENDLAQIYFHQGLYKEAHEFQKRALQRVCASSTLSNTSILYENSGNILLKLNRYTDALDNYLRALDIENRRRPLKKENVARLSSNLGMVYNNMHQFIVALTYFRHAFRMQRHISLDDSTDLAATCNSIGIVYTNIGEHRLAHKYYSQAFSISLRSLPHDHPSVQMYLKNRDIYLHETTTDDNRKPCFIEILQSRRRDSDASIDEIDIVIDPPSPRT